ncbi:hypothetical protein NPIL_392691 [Nephila pilipes]|uniref:Uncharacterized protein n=1 Tax=Nephila pilipes TaxID=299642 RepID=A0A8X6QGX1_NEPPI|nr:hypothetical protein NPIL_392691 [Nephila pilipes]
MGIFCWLLCHKKINQHIDAEIVIYGTLSKVSLQLFRCLSFLHYQPEKLKYSWRSRVRIVDEDLIVRAGTSFRLTQQINVHHKPGHQSRDHDEVTQPGGPMINK